MSVKVSWTQTYIKRGKPVTETQSKTFWVFRADKRAQIFADKLKERDGKQGVSITDIKVETV